MEGQLEGSTVAQGDNYCSNPKGDGVDLEQSGRILDVFGK